MRRSTFLLVVLTITQFFLNSSAFAEAGRRQEFADKLPSEIASTWFELLYDIVKAETTPPPSASRIYGVAAVALYESIVAGTKANRSLVGPLNGLESLPESEKNKEHHWLTVANAAIANTIRALYPAISQSSLKAINNLEQKFASQYQAQVPKQEYERSVAHVQAVATAVREWGRY
jgi:hypothetical protein